MDDIETQAAAWTSIREEFEPWSQTVNGPGSTLAATAAIRHALPGIIERFDVATILDAPCGDMNWMSLVDLSEVEYLGLDVEPTIIERNRVRFPLLNFECVNLLRDFAPPPADLVICRDFLIHIPAEDGINVLKAFRGSGSRLLLTTTSPGAEANLDELGPEGHDDRPGYWYRPVDMDAPPFSHILGGPLTTIQESDHQSMHLYNLEGDW